MLKILAVTIFLIVAVGGDKSAKITNYENVVKQSGAYNYRFDTTNGISANENGFGGYSLGGSVQWFSPENIPILLTYTADETGYHPKGDHLPTPPPIPVYILKSIEKNRLAEEQRAKSKNKSKKFESTKYD